MSADPADVQAIDRKIAEQKAAIEQSAAGVPAVANWTAANSLTVSGAVLFFGLFVFCVAAYLLRVGKSADSILKIFGTILIIVSAVFLIVAGYSDRQISPVIGLLGTIAGYLLGKETNRASPEK